MSDPPPPPRVDAHLHLWRLARGDYGWLTPDLPIHRDFGPEDAELLLRAAGVDGAVLVQAAPTEAETRFLLGLARDTPWAWGVVGWADFEAPGAPDRIAALARDPLLRGLRPMWQDIPDTGWPLRHALDPAYRAMVDHGLRLDALARVRHLPVIPRLAERHPDLPILVDHAAKPEIGATFDRDRFEAWRSGMAEVAAAVPHAMCKLSGLVTEAAPGAAVEAFRPYADALLDLFGPARLVWGSDWPVVTLRRPYPEWHAMALALTAGLTEAERGAVFGGNAVAFYGLAPRGSARAER